MTTSMSTTMTATTTTTTTGSGEKLVKDTTVPFSGASTNHELNVLSLSVPYHSLSFSHSISSSYSLSNSNSLSHSYSLFNTRFLMKSSCSNFFQLFNIMNLFIGTLCFYLSLFLVHSLLLKLSLNGGIQPTTNFHSTSQRTTNYVEGLIRTY